MPKFTVRKCEDEPLITKLQNRALRIEDSFNRILNFKNNEWWVAYDHTGKPQGYAAINISRNYAWLSICYVAPRARRQGIQRRFLQARIRYARRMGCANVHTYTMDDNVQSARSLVRAGFLPSLPSRKEGGQWAGTRGVNYWTKSL